MRPWAVEADCYSQLARVQRILHGQGLIQNHFTVENWPEGLTPSTTAPFDYAILLLYAPLALFTQYPLDWAGALVSPALWVALVFFWMLFRSREFNLAGRALSCPGSAALPAFIWATACGRPRHQSLILALMAMGLTAEYERWQIELTPKRAWNIFAGVVWGLACWTSLFEPSLVVVVLVLVQPDRAPTGKLRLSGQLREVMLVALLVEGVSHLHPAARISRGLAALVGDHPGSAADDFWASHEQERLCSVLLLPIHHLEIVGARDLNRTDGLIVVLTLLLVVLSCLSESVELLRFAGLADLVARYFQTSAPAGRASLQSGCFLPVSGTPTTSIR